MPQILLLLQHPCDSIYCFNLAVCKKSRSVSFLESYVNCYALWSSIQLCPLKTWNLTICFFSFLCDSSCIPLIFSSLYLGLWLGTVNILISNQYYLQVTGALLEVSTAYWLWMPPFHHQTFLVVIKGRKANGGAVTKEFRFHWNL